MYTIAPVDDETKVKRVRRTMLKAILGVDSPGRASSHNSPRVEGPPPEEECSFEYDLLVLGQQPSVAASALPSARPAMTTFQLSVPSADPDSSRSSPLMVPPLGALTSLAPHLVGCPGSSQMAPRQTTRQTAGQHPNVHRLPRAAGDVRAASPPAPVSNAVSALFRPWS